MNACPQGGGVRRAREARRNGAVVHPWGQSGQDRRGGETGGWACGAWSGGARGRSMPSVLRAARWVRMVSMSSGVSMHAMTRSVPPHTPQCSMSMWKTRSNACPGRVDQPNEFVPDGAYSCCLQQGTNSVVFVPLSAPCVLLPEVLASSMCFLPLLRDHAPSASSPVIASSAIVLLHRHGLSRRGVPAAWPLALCTLVAASLGDSPSWRSARGQDGP